MSNDNATLRPVLLDVSAREEVEYRPLKPVILRAAQIEQEIQRLSEREFRGSRRTIVAHPGLVDGYGLMPACTFSINVLLPGERTAPHRHNSAVVNFGVRGSGTSVIGGRRIDWHERDTSTSSRSASPTATAAC
jgi:gentisate 1,2-dioxygenase